MTSSRNDLCEQNPLVNLLKMVDNESTVKPELPTPRKGGADVLQCETFSIPWWLGNIFLFQRGIIKQFKNAHSRFLYVVSFCANIVVLIFMWLIGYGVETPMMLIVIAMTMIWLVPGNDLTTGLDYAQPEIDYYLCRKDEKLPIDLNSNLT
eukprot:UN02535